jgi:hypothetical protein
LSPRRVCHHFDHKVALEQVHGALAVPVRVGREVKAVFYGLARTMDPLGDRVLETAAAVAAAVGRELAVEFEVTRRLRIIDAERERRGASSMPLTCGRSTRSCSRSRRPPGIRRCGNAC